MRQLILKIPKGNKNRVLETAKACKGVNAITLPSEDQEVFILFLPNKNVNDFLEKLEDIEQREISFIPRGVITLHPPDTEPPERVSHVQAKSPFEIYLGGIQSVGSMFGLIGYSVAAGLIVWIGLFTTTTYLLVAAMLVAPFAGPAMNAALATASGKKDLLFSSIKRYFLALGVGALSSLILCILFPLQTLTPLMDEVSQVSKFAIFLPLISGFAGAINVCSSERDSLVSGAAVGILVAASLAPPVGLIGIGLYLQDWNVVSSSLFRIILQLLGIHLAATLVFYFFGKVSYKGIRFLKGNKLVSILSTLLVVLCLGAMMFWQFSRPPHLRKASLNTELTEGLDKVLQKLDYIEVLNKEVSFSNVEYKNKSIAKFEATVLPKDTVLPEEVLKTNIIAHLKMNLHFNDQNVYAVYQIHVVED